MTVNIKEEKIIKFQSTKFGRDLDEISLQLLSSFYDFLKNEEFENEISDCEMTLVKLLNRKYSL